MTTFLAFFLGVIAGIGVTALLFIAEGGDGDG